MGKFGIISLTIAALSVLLGERLVSLSKRSFAFREVHKKHLPNCVTLKNLDHGSEDITIIGNGLAFISTGLKYPGLPTTNDYPGKIFFLDLHDPRLKPVELRMPRNFDLDLFNPHGISAYTDPSDNRVYLFVVNHPQYKSQVEVFEYVTDTFSLVHLKTIKHELLHSVNDIVAVGTESFYATNDHYFSHELFKMLELLLLQPWTNVVYYSPEEVKVVSEGYYMANGINMSPDTRHLYVVDVFDHNVHVLKREEDNTVTSVKSVDVGSLCDNVEVDPGTGDLWLGCHTNGRKLFMFDPKDPPGSEVIRIQNIHSDQPVVTQVYLDDGDVIIGSSVATTYGGKLLIGSVFHKAVCCDLKYSICGEAADTAALRSSVILNMAALKKALLAAAVAALAMLIGFAFHRIKVKSLSSREMPVKHLKCHYLKNIDHGAEEITILDGLAFMSTGLKFPFLPWFSDDPGKMYVLDLLHPKPTPVQLRIKGELDLSSFNPHGISVYKDEADDAVYLFVVNHPEQKSQVEIFRFVEDDALVHLKTITHPLLHSVNDIVAVGPEHFYATNDKYFHSYALNFLSVVVGLQWSNVVYHSPEEVREAAGGIQAPNGINISPDKRYIYVSDIVDHEVDVFERQNGEQLVYVKSVDVGSLCDNIEVDQSTGDLWLGCHPNGSKLTKQLDPENPPGSEVLKIKDILSEQPLVSLEYGDDGRELMASTVAAVFEGKLLIGTVFHKALSCDLR
ncbi:uncharacterized protein FYW49_011694 [Xenentodon cancila]